LSASREDISLAVETLGIQNGPSNVDLIIDKKTNHVKIIEIGARIGATCLPELVEYFTGIDWVKATINSALGENPDLRVKTKKPVAALVLQAPSDGIFQSYYLMEPIDKYRVVEYEVTAKEGEEVSVLRKGTDRIGKVVCFGDTAKDAETNALNAAEKIRIILK